MPIAAAWGQPRTRSFSKGVCLGTDSRQQDAEVGDENDTLKGK